MRAAGPALIGLIAFWAIAIPWMAVPQAASANSGYAGTLKEVYGGLLTALSRTQPGTPQHQALVNAVSYIQKAMKLYEQGNYTGSLEYFNMAMAESAAATVSSGPSLQPGINASREASIEYASDLEAQLGSVTNATARTYIQGLIQEALSLLTAQASNSSQEAQNLATARHLLGLANAELQKGSRGRLAASIRESYMKALKGKHQEEVLALEAMINMSAYELVNGSAANSVYLLNGTLIDGTVGVYNGQVYSVLGFPLYYISLGGVNYSIASVTAIMAQHGHGRLHVMMERAIKGNEGIVAVLGQQESAYVESHTGSVIVVFAPAGGGFKIALLDVGTYSSRPSGLVQLSYSTTGSFSATLASEILMGLDSLESARWPFGVQAVSLSVGSDYINITWTFSNGQEYGLSLS